MKNIADRNSMVFLLHLKNTLQSFISNIGVISDNKQQNQHNIAKINGHFDIFLISLLFRLYTKYLYPNINPWMNINVKPNKFSNPKNIKNGSAIKEIE